MRIALPWPSAVLSPNSTAHWGTKATAKKKYKHAAMWAAKEKGVPQITERINLRITFIPPVTRRRDEDNCIASIKHGLDGIAKAWGVDDSIFHIADVLIAKAQKPGCVIVEVLT